MMVGSIPDCSIDCETFLRSEAVAAVKRLPQLDRCKVRAVFERRFTVERMVRDYLAIYGGLPDIGVGAMRRPHLLPSAEATVQVAA